MGKNRFSKTLKIFLSETTRLIALIFCVGLSSRYFFLFCLNYAHGATNCPASKAVVLLLLTFCLLLLQLWESVIVLSFVVRYIMSILVLQSS